MLELTVSDARSVFQDVKISTMLDALGAVGLRYLTLGQPFSTLSGGESQRLKLASVLPRAPENALYVLDEPTTGLHMTDVGHFVAILDRLVDAGNTVIVIEAAAVFTGVALVASLVPALRPASVEPTTALRAD